MQGVNITQAMLDSYSELKLVSKNLKDITDVSKFRNVTTLNLSGNNITNLNPIASLRSLDYLQLTGNSKLEDLSGIRNVTSLTTLYLRSTKVSYIDYLFNLTNLRTLDLTNTKVSDEDIVRLQEHLPNCHITH